MIIVEVRKSGNLFARREVLESNVPKTGCRIRLPFSEEISLKVGESKTHNDYEIRMIAEPPLRERPVDEHAAPADSAGETEPLVLDFSETTVEHRTVGHRNQLKPTAPTIEGYKILSLLFQGGMGTVWRAVQLSTHREVALKILSENRYNSEKARSRFEREIKLAARLEHPHIGRIYDSGLCHNQYYYAMELIAGEHLDDYVKRHQLCQNDILSLMQTVCEAVGYAHQREVIHRDIKPSNILVDANGQPHVLDFGLAKPLKESDPSLLISQEGDSPGTPAYMSPEQAAGHTDTLNARTDVYSLGVILYRLLLDKMPHDITGTSIELLYRISHEDVRPPRELDKTLDPELDAILTRALSRDPDSRHSCGCAFAVSLEQYLQAHEQKPSPAPIQTASPRRIYAAALVFIMLAAGITGLVWWAHNKSAAPIITVPKPETIAQRLEQLLRPVESYLQEAGGNVVFLRRSGSDGTRTLLDKKIEDEICKCLKTLRSDSYLGMVDQISESTTTLSVTRKAEKDFLSISVQLHQGSKNREISQVEIEMDESMRQNLAQTLATPDEVKANPRLKPDLLEYIPLEITFSLTGLHQANEGNWKYVDLENGDNVYSKDCFQISFQTNQDCYVYVLLYGSEGKADCLFPHEKIDLDNLGKARIRYTIPDQGNWYHLDENRGTETFYVVAGSEPLTNIVELLRQMEVVEEKQQIQIAENLRKAILDMEAQKIDPDKYIQRTCDRPMAAPIQEWDIQHENRAIKAMTQLLEGKISLVKVIKLNHL
jgi:protein kinase-like protein/uncharacterized protein DUF4384